MKKSRIFTKSRKPRVTENASPFIRLLVCCGKAVGIALLAAIVLLTSGGLIGYSLRDPIKSITPVSLISLFTSFFICGFASSKFERGNPIVTGLLSASIYLAFIFIVSLALGSSAERSVTPASSIIFALPCSVVGAFFGNIRIPKRRNVYHSRKR